MINPAPEIAGIYSERGKLVGDDEFIMMITYPSTSTSTVAAVWVLASLGLPCTGSPTLTHSG